ncbi:MAG: AAA family ATPase, partial [Deltaproteobacteria bacterium]|nr:AAA family ATPase [Deltaproteobacteria bacterium]
MAQYDINLREYWRILKKRKAIVILTAVVLGFFSTAFAIFRAPTPLFISTCSIKFEKETTVEGLYARTISWSGSDDIETQISIIKSYTVFEKVAEKLGLIPKRKIKEAPLRHHVIGIIERLQSKVNVSREEFTNILHIRVTDASPVFARNLANTVALSYKALHSDQQMRRTTEALKYISDQLKTVREKLRESENEFNAFSQNNQLVSIDLQSENLLVLNQEIQTELRKIRTDRNEIEAILKRLEGFLKDPSGSESNFFAAAAGSRYQSTNDKLIELLLKKDTLLEDFTPRHPEIVAVNRKVVETARKMFLLLQLKIRELDNKELDLKEETGKVAGKTQVLMERKLEYNRLKRKVTLYNDMTSLLERKNQEALIRRAEKPEEITIVKPALLPSTPINPPRTAATGAMGILIGVILGLVTAFIVETFDTSLGAIEDVEEILGSQVLGVIPFADIREIQESLDELQPERMKDSGKIETAHLVSHLSPKSMVAESFRGLRTNIQFKDAERPIKVISVTSASPQEGKTLVSINLAITMAQAGMKILLVGSDMRKPVMGRAFGVEITPGLADYLLGNYPWPDTVKTITDLIMGHMSLDDVMLTPGLDNLNIITSGSLPPNPAVLIESKRLMEFIDEAKNEYDFIIFDSPPILSTADAAVLGAKMDGVLLVYRVGAVSRGLLKRATTQLEQVKCELLGVILNGMKPEFSPDFQDFKYYKYYHAYGNEEKERRGKDGKRILQFFRRKGARKERAILPSES